MDAVVDAEPGEYVAVHRFSRLVTPLVLGIWDAHDSRDLHDQQVLGGMALASDGADLFVPLDQDDGDATDAPLTELAGGWAGDSGGGE
jgi:hypothetical protein